MNHSQVLSGNDVGFSQVLRLGMDIPGHGDLTLVLCKISNDKLGQVYPRHNNMLLWTEDEKLLYQNSKGEQFDVVFQKIKKGQ